MIEPGLGRLIRASARTSFIYLERVTIDRENNGLRVSNISEQAFIPAATIGAYLLGPGTTVTHAAVSLIAEHGSSIVWVGENGVRYYAHGRGQTQGSRIIVAQAKAVSNERTRLAAAKRMYGLRYPGEDLDGLNMKQLLGREGQRVKKSYKANAERYGIAWSGRSYELGKFDDSTPINQALSSANSALYGVVHATIVAVGASPELGIIHSGKDRSFVFDIADVLKAETSIPAAFEAVAANPIELSRTVRQLVRDRVFSGNVIERTIETIKIAIGVDTDDEELDENELWAGADQFVPGGKTQP